MSIHSYYDTPECRRFDCHQRSAPTNKVALSDDRKMSGNIKILIMGYNKSLYS